MERLQKVIAASGVASRRKAEELIKLGKVQVNGEVITTMGYKVSGNDSIIVEGKLLQREDKVYYLLNKPRGVICTVQDDKNRKTVVDLINTDKRIFPIGRLDYDTTGILLLTNDGTLANILMHPSSLVPKTYIAKLNKMITIEDLKKIKSGLIIDGIKTIPTKVSLKKNDKVHSLVEISIVEGRNHIVKKIFASMGYLVDKLSRISYGYLHLKGLKSGEYRELTIKEVKKLYEYSKHENRKIR